MNESSPTSLVYLRTLHKIPCLCKDSLALYNFLPFLPCQWQNKNNFDWIEETFLPLALCLEHGVVTLRSIHLVGTIKDSLKHNQILHLPIFTVFIFIFFVFVSVSLHSFIYLLFKFVSNCLHTNKLSIQSKTTKWIRHSTNQHIWRQNWCALIGGLLMVPFWLPFYSTSFLPN